MTGESDLVQSVVLGEERSLSRFTPESDQDVGTDIRVAGGLGAVVVHDEFACVCEYPDLAADQVGGTEYLFMRTLTCA